MIIDPFGGIQVMPPQQAESERSKFESSAIYLPVWNVLIYLACFALGVWSWQSGLWPITVLCWIPLAYFSHAILMAFHEASHGNLRPRHWDNEIRGTLIGWFSLVPLSAYRVVHMSHHGHLAEPTDAELWPYCDPSVPRWLRRLCVWGEIIGGLFVTPILFTRGVLKAQGVSRYQWRKVIQGYVAMTAFWAILLTIIGWFNVWGEFLMVFVAPAFLAGMLQSLRKFTEHLGLMGNTPETAARTIVDHSLVGRFLETTMLNITYHTAHHRDASLLYHELPQATAEAVALDPQSNPIYSSYWQAFVDMMPSLADPKVGEQWVNAPSQERWKHVPA
jgi:fatty acid desaturase